MSGPNAGRRGRRWENLKANQRAKRLPCWICRQPIDYTLAWPDPGSFSVDHAKSWHDHPELREDPGNLRSAHLDCNSSRGKAAADDLTFETSRDW